MKQAWIIGILALFILAACAPTAPPAEKAPVTAPAPEEKEPVAPPAAPEEPEVGVKPPIRPLPSEREVTPPAEVVVEPKQEMSPQLRDLLKRADEKLTSLKYLYGGTATGNLFLDTHFVKGTKTKIKKFSEDYYVREGYYDTIYVDLSLACCEEQSRCKSHNVDNTNKKFDVDVSTLKIPKTPYQWTKEIPASAKIIGPQTFNQRSVTFIKYTDANGQEVQMWVDDTYGVPHKIVIIDSNGNEVKHQFNDLLFNTLKDGDFDPPCA